MLGIPDRFAVDEWHDIERRGGWAAVQSVIVAGLPGLGICYFGTRFGAALHVQGVLLGAGVVRARHQNVHAGGLAAGQEFFENGLQGRVAVFDFSTGHWVSEEGGLCSETHRRGRLCWPNPTESEDGLTAARRGDQQIHLHHKPPGRERICDIDGAPGGVVLRRQIDQTARGCGTDVAGHRSAQRPGDAVSSRGRGRGRGLHRSGADEVLQQLQVRLAQLLGVRYLRRGQFAGSLGGLDDRVDFGSGSGLAVGGEGGFSVSSALAHRLEVSLRDVRRFIDAELRLSGGGDIGSRRGAHGFSSSFGVCGAFFRCGRSSRDVRIRSGGDQAKKLNQEFTHV